MNIGRFYTPDQLVFLDECYIDKRNTARLDGWAPVGERAFVQQPFIRGRRYSYKEFPIPKLTPLQIHYSPRFIIRWHNSLQRYRRVMQFLCIQSVLRRAYG
jgi:hypothetical protein